MIWGILVWNVWWVVLEELGREKGIGGIGSNFEKRLEGDERIMFGFLVGGCVRHSFVDISSVENMHGQKQRN